MSPPFSTRIRSSQLPLRWFLVILFTIQLLGVVGLTNWLALRNGEEAVNDVTHQLHSEVVGYIEDKLLSLLKIPIRVNQNNAQSIRLNLLNPQDLPTLERYFWNQLHQFEELALVSLTTKEGDFIGAERHKDGEITINIATSKTDFSLEEWETNEQGKRIRKLRSLPNQDPRTNPIYKVLKVTRKDQWSNVHFLTTTQWPVISAHQSLYTSQGEFLGVIRVDIALGQISYFLTQLSIGQTGATFIIDRSGSLMASSLPETLRLSHHPDSLQRKAIESDHAIIRETAQYLTEQFSTFDQIQDPQKLSFYFRKEQHLVKVTSFANDLGIDWLIVLVVPESEFMSPIYDNTRRTILLSFLAPGITISLAVLTAQWITEPILDLSKASQAIAQGSLNQIIGPKKIQEFDFLGQCFNLMANHLKKSIDELKAMNQSLGKRVQQRTAELQKQQDFLRKIIDTDPNLIYIKDADGHLILVNQSLAQLLGFPITKIIGKKETDLIPNLEDLEEYQKNDRQILEKNVTVVFEEKFTQPNGEVLYFESIKTPFLTPDTNRPLILGISINITHHKHIEQSLQEAKEAADRANQAKTDFLANMSHELRTPLNGILGYAQILQRANDLNDHRRGVEVIQQAGSYLLNLINDILDLSKIEARKLELIPQSFHLHTLLLSVAEIIRIRAEEKGLDFHYLPDENLPLGIIADQKRLRQILINLLGNSVKFTERGEVKFIITPTPSETPNSVTIKFAIQDTGVGMTPEDLQKIFLPFEQVGEKSKQAEGTGLGLAICQQIVQMMGSTIQVDSILGEGSTFWFEIDFPLSSQSDFDPTDYQGKVIGYRGKQRKIMVVDDLSTNRLVLSALLKTLGFTVVEAENGQGALLLLQELNPDLIITDLMMPELDGYEMTQFIRELPGYQSLPIIASSASVSQGDQNRALAAGCNDFIPKPVKVEQLLASLKRHLQLQWLYEEVSHPPISTATLPTHLIYPPADQLRGLYQAAKIGDIDEIEKQARYLQSLHQDYHAFGDRLLQLAQNFDDMGIIKIIEPIILNSH